MITSSLIVLVISPASSGLSDFVNTVYVLGSTESESVVKVEVGVADCGLCGWRLSFQLRAVGVLLVSSHLIEDGVGVSLGIVLLDCVIQWEGWDTSSSPDGTCAAAAHRQLGESSSLVAVLLLTLFLADPLQLFLLLLHLGVLRSASFCALSSSSATICVQSVESSNSLLHFCCVAAASVVLAAELFVFLFLFLLSLFLLLFLFSSQLFSFVLLLAPVSFFGGALRSVAPAGRKFALLFRCFSCCCTCFSASSKIPDQLISSEESRLLFWAVFPGAASNFPVCVLLVCILSVLLHHLLFRKKEIDIPLVSLCVRFPAENCIGVVVVECVRSAGAASAPSSTFCSVSDVLAEFFSVLVVATTFAVEFFGVAKIVVIPPGFVRIVVISPGVAENSSLGFLFLISVAGFGVLKMARLGKDSFTSLRQAHFSSFHANCCISSKVSLGASIRMLPSAPILYCNSTARQTSLELSIRSIWPNQQRRRLLIAATRSKVGSLASWCVVLPVNLERSRLFAPFSFRIVAGVRVHDSLP